MICRPSRIIVFLCALGALTSVSAAPMTEEQAQAVLEDDSFFRHWSTPGTLETVPQAEEAKKEAQRVSANLETALKDMTKVCYDKFFVNHCIDEARRLNMTREREVRQISNQADSIIRAEKTREIQERRAKAAAEVKEPPMKPNGGDAKKPKAPKEPSPVTPKTPKAPSTPSGFTPKAPQPASEPMKVDNTAAQRVKEKQDEAAAKRAQEEENVKRFEEKQRAAKARLESAESQAKSRQAERAAQQADYEKSRKEREDAQHRLQDQQNQSRSSLSKFF